MFPHGQLIERDRRGTEQDPYNPNRTRPKTDWTDPATVTVEDAWIGTPSISGSSDAARSNTTALSSLYCSADADVRAGDRIRCNGHTWTVDAVPMPVGNPFTGWMPPLEIPLVEVHDP